MKRKTIELFRTHKFYAKPKTIDNIRFASSSEAHRYVELRRMEKLGIISGLVLQKKFSFEVAGKHICNYICDFVYKAPGIDKLVVEDVKGFETPEFKIKKKLFLALYGDKYHFHQYNTSVGRSASLLPR